VRRRTLLATAGTLAVGGCAGRPGTGEDPTTTSTGTPTETPTTGEPASVETATAVGYWYGDDSYAVERPDGDLFAFVTPTGDDPGPVETFSLVLDDRTFEPVGVPGNGVEMPGVGSVYGEDGADGAGPVLFDLPTVEAEAGALVGRNRHPLPATGLAALAAAPRVNVESVSVPTTVGTGERVAVELEVTNTGERAGRVFAAVRWAFDVRGFLEGTVPAGGRTGLAGTFEHDGSTGTRYGTVHYPGGRTGLEVTVVRQTTTPTTGPTVSDG
jgi:hypothetical protein